MSKGNKAVCMRLPPSLLERMEAEAAAQGVTVPELCRRKIVEGNPSVGMVGVTEQVTPITTPSTNVGLSRDSRIEAPAPNSVRLPQKVEEAIARGIATKVLADLLANHPELSPPTEAMVYAGKGLAWIAENHSEFLNKWIEESIASGRMSGSELVEYYTLFAIYGDKQGPAATQTERKIH